jgi:hypothetical protein
VLQGKLCHRAAKDVVGKVVRMMHTKFGQVFDDTSCMVIDCKPDADETTKTYDASGGKSRSCSRSSLVQEQLGRTGKVQAAGSLVPPIGAKMA